MISLFHSLLIFIIILVVSFLYKKYEQKHIFNENNLDNYHLIKRYLIEESDLAKSKKPNMFIHIDYEYNARNWLSFGSRSSCELNQPYLYLTLKSIITQCNHSFNICIIDDVSFKKLIPNWSIDMNMLSEPIKGYVRQLGISKLIYYYGGMSVPLSFLCFKDLNEMFERGTNMDKMFVCETLDINITNTTRDFYPNINFIGSSKNNITMSEMIAFMEKKISSDYTEQNNFLGDFNRWINRKVQQHKIILIDGGLIGVKDTNDEPILLDNLLEENYIQIQDDTYGILIPADQILKRTKYEYFSRMSVEQVLESNCILSKYILLSNTPEGMTGTINDSIKKPKKWWVGFFKTDLNEPYWGVRPLNAAAMDRVPILKYPPK